MTQNRQGLAGPFDLEIDRPRRAAVRTMGAAGAALLGVIGLGAVADANGRGAQRAGAEKKGGKRGPTGPTGPAGASGGFTLKDYQSEEKFVEANSTTGGIMSCERGKLISGGYILSHTGCWTYFNSKSGTDWIVSVRCPPAVATSFYVAVTCME
jgi:hypothetical protein